MPYCEANNFTYRICIKSTHPKWASFVQPKAHSGEIISWPPIFLVVLGLNPCQEGPLLTFEIHFLRSCSQFPFCSSSTSVLSFELTMAQRLYKIPRLLSFKRYNTAYLETSGSDIVVRLRILSSRHAPLVHEVPRGDRKQVSKFALWVLYSGGSLTSVLTAPGSSGYTQSAFCQQNK